MPTARQSARQRHNVLVRHRGADDPATVDAKRDLRAAHLEEHVREAVAGWPPLSDEQRSEIAALLRPVGRTPDDCTVR
jgi:hypothetical protein